MLTGKINKKPEGRYNRIVSLLFLIWMLFLFPASAEVTDNGIQKRIVKVGIYDNLPKISMANGKPEGIFIDILKNIAEKEGWELQYIYGNWNQNLALFEAGSIDLIPDMAFSEVRSQKYDFNKIPVLSSWLQVYSHKNVVIRSFSDLNGKVISVLKGSNQNRVSLDIRNNFNLDFTLLERPDYEATINDVKTGQADALVGDRFFAYVENTDYIIQTPLLLNSSSLHFAVYKGRNQDLILTIDNYMSRFVNNNRSVYYNSLSNWLQEKPRFLIPVYILWVLAIISFILFILIITSFLFRWQLRERTKELVELNGKLQNTVMELESNKKQIKSALVEKEKLLQELYHRTKNNMGVICSLLSIKSKMSDNAEIIEFAGEIENKISAMAMVHTMLYRSPDLSGINIRDYVEELVKTSVQYLSSLNKNVSFKINVEPLVILIDTAVPFGMVLNELITNSYKYAFCDSTAGIIEINLYMKKKEHIFFSYSDNGPGLPADLQINDTGTFGLLMVFDMITKQMEGKISYTVENGLKYEIEFPTTLYSRRI